MRPFCWNCTRKHLAQAHILMMEAAQGYPDHAWLAIGHMAEASEEIRGVSIELSDRIRSARKAYESDRTQVPPIMALITEVGALIPTTIGATPTVVHHAPPPSKDLPSAADWARIREQAAALEPTRERVIDPVADKAVADDAEAQHRAMLRGKGQWVAPPHDPAVPTSPAPAGGCGGCAENALYENLSRALHFSIKPRTLILTTLADFHPSYSLTSVILEQAHALAMVGHQVVLAVHRGCDSTHLPPLPPEIILMPVVPLISGTVDVIHEEQVTQQSEMMTRLIRTMLANQHGSTQVSVIAHDLLFQSGFVSIAKAIWSLPEDTQPPIVGWWHMAHSSVGTRPAEMFSGGRPLPHYYRHTLPEGHKLFVLNHADVHPFMEYYETTQENVVTLLNPRDIRPHLRMTETASRLTTQYGLHTADVTIMLPLSLPRVKDKGLDKVLDVVGALKRMGLIVRLLVPTAHANGNEHHLTWVLEHCAKNDLRVAPAVKPSPQAEPTGVTAIDLRAPPPVDVTAADVIITCMVLPETSTYGLDADTIRSLWGITNLFLLPSISEAGSLVLLEAALSGCVLVLNASLPALHDYIKLTEAIWVPWGSLKGPGQEMTTEALNALADRIWNTLATKGPKRRIMRDHSLEVYGLRLGNLLSPEAAVDYTDG